MKVEGEDIIITDPCYISHKEDWGKGFDFCDNSIDSSLGFSDYLFEHTGQGDGSWEVYSTPRKESLNRLKELLKGIYEDEDYEYKLPGKKIGEFAADAGMSAVFKLEEVEEYGPKDDIDGLIENGCATIIKNWTGEIIAFRDESKSLHFIGIGDKSFYTV